MPAMTPLAKLIVIVVLALAEIVNVIWGLELYGLRNEQMVSVVVTLVLAAVGMVVTVPHHPPARP